MRENEVPKMTPRFWMEENRKRGVVWERRGKGRGEKGLGGGGGGVGQEEQVKFSWVC